MYLVSDFCNRINQASCFKLYKTVVKLSKIVKVSINLLYKLGYIMLFNIRNSKYLLVFLKYTINGAAIRGLFCLSKPSLAFHISYKNISKFCFNSFFGLIGFMAICTNSGRLMFDFECISNKLGGLALWAVY